MEPSLIPKFLEYRKRKRSKQVKMDPKTNDSGVTLQDMQSNDVWSILFMLLLTHNFRFANCYSYTSEDPFGPVISFDVKLFKNLFITVLRAYELDRNFCYVLNSLCKFERFSGVKDSLIKKNFTNLVPNHQSLRDLKYYIWLLTYCQYPHWKIQDYENGKRLKEVDEYDTLGDDDSIYNTSTEELPMESIVTYYQTGQQINEKYMKNGKGMPIFDSIREESGESEIVHDIKLNELNQKIGADFSYSFEQTEESTAGEKFVAKRTGYIDYLIKKNDQQDKTRTKGILTLESDIKVIKKKNTLDILKNPAKKDGSASGPNKWTNIQKFHEDTEKTKEFSDIQLGGIKFLNQFSIEEQNETKEDEQSLSKQTEEIQREDVKLPLKNKGRIRKKPKKPPIIKHTAPSRNMSKSKDMKIKVANYTSMETMNSLSYKNSVKFTSQKIKKPKRRISRSISRKKLQSSNGISKNSTEWSSNLHIIKNLTKMVKNHLHTSTLEDYTNQGKDGFPDIDHYKLDHEKDLGKCTCQLCKNPRKSRSRRGSYRSRKSFDSRKSAEEIQEDKKKNRQRQNSRSVKKRQEPRYEDPYKKRKSFNIINPVINRNILQNQYSSPRKRALKRRASGYIPKLNIGSNNESKSRFERSKSRSNSRFVKESK